MQRKTVTADLGVPTFTKNVKMGQPPGEKGAVEIESRSTARRREQLGVYPVVRRRDVS